MKKINVEIDRAAAAGLSDLHAKVGVLEISSNIGFVEPAEVYRQAPRHHHAGACDRFTPAQPMRGGWASTLVVMKNERPAAKFGKRLVDAAFMLD